MIKSPVRQQGCLLGWCSAQGRLRHELVNNARRQHGQIERGGHLQRLLLLRVRQSYLRHEWREKAAGRIGRW